jgi:hypothetical protein
MSEISASQYYNIVSSGMWQQNIFGLSAGDVLSDRRDNVTVADEKNLVIVFDAPKLGDFSFQTKQLSISLSEDVILIGIQKHRKRLRYYAISFCIFMTVTSAFLGMMAYYYTTGVAVIHPYLIIVGVLGSLSLVATSVVDIFEHNK